MSLTNIDPIIIRGFFYLIAFLVVVRTVFVIESVSSSSSRFGLRMLYWPMIAYTSGMVIITAIKLLGFLPVSATWPLMIPTVFVIVCQVLLWRWWRTGSMK